VVKSGGVAAKLKKWYSSKHILLECCMLPGAKCLLYVFSGGNWGLWVRIAFRDEPVSHFVSK